LLLSSYGYGAGTDLWDEAMSPNQIKLQMSAIVERLIPWAVCGLVIWGIGLYAWQQSANRRLDEIERQNIRQWESIDANKTGERWAEYDEWKRWIEPIVRKQAEP